jgi:hypothetical protein
MYSIKLKNYKSFDISYWQILKEQTVMLTLFPVISKMHLACIGSSLAFGGLIRKRMTSM